MECNVCVSYSKKALSWRVISIEETKHGQDIHVLVDRSRGVVIIPSYEFKKRKGTWVDPRKILKSFWVTRHGKTY